MPDSTNELLTLIHHDMGELKQEMRQMRVDLTNNRLDVAALKTKAGIFATAVALVASAFMTWLSRVFFSP